MAWIESHQELADHPKTRRLMRLLGLDRYAAIGLVHVLWYWALDYADSGDLSACSDEDVADGVRWERDASELVSALTTAGFLNVDRTIHDWEEFAGRYVAKRQANAERMRAARAAESPPPPPSNGTRAEHVQRTTDARAANVSVCAGATGTLPVPNLTVKEPEDEDAAPAAPAASAAPESVERLNELLTGQSGWEPSPDFLRKVAAKYPQLDLEAEAFKMLSWLPSKQNRKHQVCSTRFVLNWLQKATEAPPAASARASPQSIHSGRSQESRNPRDYFAAARR